MFGALVFAYSVGAISSVNPCGFALLPAYFARRLSLDTGGKVTETAAITFALSAGAVATAGFVLIFGIVGGIIAMGAFWLSAVLPWTGFAIGLVLAVIGIYILAGRHIGINLATDWSNKSTNALAGDFLFGLGYGTASLSCTLPIFLSVTGVATTGGLLQSALSLVAFALGMGTILIAIAVAAVFSHNGLALTFKKFLPYADKVSGAIMLLAGVYVVFYWGEVLFGPEIPSASGVVGFAEQISGRLRNWLDSGVGQAIIFVLLGYFVVSFVWSKWRPQSIFKGDTR